jgi:PAS domain S-box-containing protein
MKKPQIPLYESERLAALNRYKILDTLPEQEYDDLTQLAADICGTPIALISLVDRDRQWFKSRVGLEATETSRDISFCGHAVAEGAILNIPDTIKDVRFADNPLVIQDPKIRFYVGVPLTTPDRYTLGTLCVIDRQPRELTPKQIQQLQALGRLVMSQLELRLSVEFSERQAAEGALRKSEERLRLALRAANQGLYDLNLETGEAIVSPEYATMLGYDPDTFQETNARWIDRLHPDDQEIVANTYKDYVAGNLSEYKVEFRQRTQSGEWKWLLSLGKILEWDELGNPLRMLGIHTDISDRKQAETALQQLNQELEAKVLERTQELQRINIMQRAILDSADYSFISTEPNGIIQTFNAAAERMLGYKAAEVIGKVTPTIIHDRQEVIDRAASLSVELDRDIPIGFQVFVAKARLGLISEEEWTYIRKDGSRLPVSLSVTPLTILRTNKKRRQKSYSSDKVQVLKQNTK